MSIKYFFCLKCINLYLQHYCPLIPECNKHAPNRYCRARKSETTTDTSCRKNLPHSVVSPDKILLLKLHQWQALLSATDSPTWRKGTEHPFETSSCHECKTLQGITMQRAPEFSRKAPLLCKLFTIGVGSN